MDALAMLYETDYSAWAKRNAELLRAGRFDELDLEHLLEELSDMSKSDRRELRSRLLVLLAHLLKWEFQYRRLSERWREFDGRSWRSTIVEQRKQLNDLLKQSPGLKGVLEETLTATYSDAVELASDETGLARDSFPARCPYTPEQVLDKHFHPEPRE
jgi:hypothetical protein